MRQIKINPSWPSPVDEKTGLIRYLIDIPVEPGEPRIFNASVKMADTVRYMQGPCFDNNGGSGLTRSAARAAAIGEGVERYCATSYDPNSLLLGTARELGRDHAVSPPESYALFHKDQEVPVPHFTDNTIVAWEWGFSLVNNRPILVPACQVYMPYKPLFREQGEQVIGPVVSTGMACAGSYEEAMLKGIYEVVERDAFMITWMNCLPRNSIDYRSDPFLLDLYQMRLQCDGLTYLLVDMTTDINIPSLFCILIDERRSPPMICVGGASNLDPIKAAAKAMMEAAQTFEWAKFMGRGGRTFDFASDFSDIRDFEDHVALYGYGDMLPAIDFLKESTSVKTMADFTSVATGDNSVDLAHAVNILAKMDLNVIALDMTTEDVKQCGYFVTRIIIPGLQPLHADYLHRFIGGKRLYEVPQRLGFAAEPTTPAQLNPNPHPYP